jgi:hypothetical protein
MVASSPTHDKAGEAIVGVAAASCGTPVISEA